MSQINPSQTEQSANQKRFDQYDTSALWKNDKDHHLYPWQAFDFFNQENALIIAEGEGAYIYDTEGKRYLGLVGGLWCNNIGLGPFKCYFGITAL